MVHSLFFNYFVMVFTCIALVGCATAVDVVVKSDDSSLSSSDSDSDDSSDDDGAESGAANSMIRVSHSICVGFIGVSNLQC